MFCYNFFQGSSAGRWIRQQAGKGEGGENSGALSVPGQAGSPAGRCVGGGDCCQARPQSHSRSCCWHLQKLSVDLEPLQKALEALPNAITFNKTGKLEDTYWAVVKHFGVTWVAMSSVRKWHLVVRMQSVANWGGLLYHLVSRVWICLLEWLYLDFYSVFQ